MAVNDEDVIAYRIAVANLMQDNKSKYPAFNMLLHIAKTQGTLALSATFIAAAMDCSFHDNETIAECARRLEETVEKSKDDAVAQFLMDFGFDPTKTH